MEEKSNETLLSHLRNELRNENIKLWEEPYTSIDGCQTVHVLTLSSKLSAKLKLPEPQVLSGLEHLRVHALERQRQNIRFRVDKIATLKLKFSSKSMCKQLQGIETKLDITGQELTNLLSGKLDVSSESLKLVYGGKMIIRELALNEQGVQHGKTIMCLYFPPEGKLKASEAEKEMQEVRQARRGAELLATSSSSSVSTYDAQITDQNGRALDIPEEEKVSLMVGLALHEKGREVLKNEKYSFALLFLLEAETEFCQCRSDILNQVDNFAVLHLDISWCYLQMENLDALPDASKRLKICESFFKRSYGESLQRLRAIKGSTGHEVALFVRLYVLQGIVAFHEGKLTAARDLFAKAQFYASSVQVDSSQIAEMVNVGFTVPEARLALRVCDGNLLAATRHAFQKREEKARIDKEETEKSRKRKLAQFLGNCSNGNELDIDVYEKMVNELGFDRILAAEALKISNNNMDEAMQAIHENPDSLKPENLLIPEALVQQVVEAGFNADSARAVLFHFNGNYNEAVDYLLSNQGDVDQSWVEEAKSSSSFEHSGKKLEKSDRDAVRMMRKVVKSDADNYLDIELNRELEYVTVYLAKIGSVLTV